MTFYMYRVEMGHCTVTLSLSLLQLELLQTDPLCVGINAEYLKR